MVVAFMLCLGECDASGEVVRFTSSSVRSPVCLAIDSSRRRRSRSRTLVWNRRQLEQLLREYVEHHNTHGPTAVSVNARPTIAASSPIRPASRSDDTRPSTSTGKQPERPTTANSPRTHRL